MKDYEILIIEDEKKMSMFIQMELDHEGYVTDVEYNGRDGLKKIQNGNYNLVLLDIMLPELNGIEVCRRVRQFSKVPIIMITAKDDVTDKVMGLDIGADDYLTKPFAIEELLARIRVIRRNNVEKSGNHEYKVNNLIMNTKTHEVIRGGKFIELTKKEYDLLEFLLKNKNVVLTRDKLIEKIWGYDYFSDTNVVSVFIRYLRSKIDDGFDDKLITTVRGVGYVIKGDK
ncbi:response regulator transcription factor [Clostridium tyrobutyricum]|uniref:response regulator transcription factor n=1 Tax=Clostridium tyrobutyricum TaxID=1519 RepID=UPI00057D3D5B|nr:response regulator transcription factor [Clostridium tyrobutyricum]MBV4416176.1 response regulator transcription factor [Clostridium tyrobutyricum]MBV4416223.1 response regulator transcription factor [Clostridium tyrobutyricum]MBV4422812.1 response regulator transcription factor [Clostridium tyrobutyricum]MBV4427082.1 response regulator transcription factor [Clostridium tyrobutyricum]MBV4442191.1 response regulator transcription factor [Clostridium tyrobutyricum]